jgi:antitoxin FitA
MPTLYVENVPEDIYNALRKRARANHKSIAAEIITLLKQSIPTAAELKRRREFYVRLSEFRAQSPATPGPFPTAEEMVRENRER